MFSKGTNAPKAPMLLKDFLKVCSLMIVLKNLPSGVVSLRDFLTCSLAHVPKAPMLLRLLCSQRIVLRRFLAGLSSRICLQICSP